MRNVTSKIINGPYGSIKPITFKNFLSLIGTNIHPDNTSYAIFSKKVLFDRYVIKNPDISYPSYNSEVLYLQYDNVLPSDILKHLNIEECDKTSLLDMVYDIATTSICNNGSPSHLVLMAPRLWMCANPKDFAIHGSNVGMNIACFYPQKTICWAVKKGEL
jgi:hypothetical protein